MSLDVAAATLRQHQPAILAAAQQARDQGRPAILVKLAHDGRWRACYPTPLDAFTAENLNAGAGGPLAHGHVVVHLDAHALLTLADVRAAVDAWVDMRRAQGERPLELPERELLVRGAVWRRTI